MPVLAKFYGIVIRMLCARNLGARFHAFYHDHELIVNIWPLQVVGGEAPEWVRAKVLEWAGLHQQELLDAWNCCRLHCPPQRIAS
jgi:hypothetical protein